MLQAVVVVEKATQTQGLAEQVGATQVRVALAAAAPYQEVLEETKHLVVVAAVRKTGRSEMAATARNAIVMAPAVVQVGTVVVVGTVTALAFRDMLAQVAAADPTTSADWTQSPPTSAGLVTHTTSRSSIQNSR
ncbi:hypothetical protein C461_03158 [Halorubrum aidingense JCM 13560]|uniref:Uncharacterized protein n=1 Tax=Halorubrum aidingense JCM 13560 TaxID=1230454 RepID=M0PGX4_9EURY|nr:hypothetical protein C461_03158 [Halorubrum aidingense JCM 13560]